MKKIYLIATVLLGMATATAQVGFGQIQNQISRDKNGINQFDVKKDTVQYKGLSIDIGAAFALQFQGVNSFNGQENLPAPISGYRLNNLENNFNLPTANFTIGAQLFDGVRVNLDVYLASRHHHETWVKGGYLQIDKLDFIKKDFLADFMKYTTIKIGQMENNYGDAHFRRSDNGNALMNPFIGNNIMDAFITEMGAELYYNRSGFVGMIGVTNSKLDQDVKEVKQASPTHNTTVSPTILAKIGFDKQLDPDLRIRLTGSLYHTANSSGNLYASDRAGSRFYGVMSHSDYTGANGAPVADNFDPTANKDTGRFNPGYGNWATSYMINPFVKYKGFEFFGTLEFTSGGDAKGVETSRSVNQYAGDIVYRFGTNENLFVGAKYNLVDGKLRNSDAEAVNITRFETSAGWFMTKNILAKIGYVDQRYKNYSQFNAAGNPNDLYKGKFNGVMFEAVITF
ncbi:hypothetical protein [Flavobacterium sp. 140616W15]|uniref:hypothetical protein n=1 Tax=Flavobacterium sp. 140616W15 TaxID=2478552 RepID=UPI000F0CBDE7|nr:hypothetical protein [Flavobacterium sp. 140616W15]AYN06438.1 hypothetical protein EAG11_21535 [Flavobacterium sp. 140616W15]